MKLKYVLYMAAALSLTGCNDSFLERGPQNLNDQSFWVSVNDLKAYANAFYGLIPVAVAKQILENQIESANAVNRADEKVQQAYKNSRDGIVILPCYLPWKNGLYKTDALFVIYPSQRGGWSAQCVTDHKTKKPKLPFPQSWAGQPQEVIEQKSGIPGISFCHASRFLITAKDKETALAACRQVLKNNGRI